MHVCTNIVMPSIVCQRQDIDMRTQFGSRVKRFNHLVLKLIDWLSAVEVDSWSIRVPHLEAAASHTVAAASPAHRRCTWRRLRLSLLPHAARAAPLLLQSAIPWIGSL